MRKPIVHSPRRQLFFAESSELCFQTKTSLKISQFTLFLLIQSFSHPIGDKKVRKYIHTYAFTRLSHANFLIKLVCDSKYTIPAQKMMMGNSLLNSKVTCVAMELLAKNVRAFRNIKVSIRICKCQKSKTILKQS